MCILLFKVWVTLQSDHDGDCDVDLLSGSNDASCYLITLHNASKYIHKYSVHLTGREGGREGGRERGREGEKTG